MNLCKRLFEFHSLLIIMSLSLFIEPCLSQSNQIIQEISDWERLPLQKQYKIKNIPKDVLENISTEKLVELCVNTRYTLFLFAYNSLEEGFTRFLNEYNGLRELLNRNDAAIHLIDFYKKISTNGYNQNWKQEEIGKYLHKIIVTEVFLSADIILNKLSKSDVKILLAECLKKNYEKNSNIEVHSIFGLEKNAFAITKIISNKGRNNKFDEKITKNTNLNYLMLNAKFKDYSDNNDLVNIANEFLKNY